MHVTFTYAPPGGPAETIDLPNCTGDLYRELRDAQAVHRPVEWTQALPAPGKLSWDWRQLDPRWIDNVQVH